MALLYEEISTMIKWVLEFLAQGLKQSDFRSEN